MLSSMVGSTSPLTESNPSATSSEKGDASSDARDTFTTAAKATLEHPSSYLNTPLNANELNASNEADPLTFLPSMMEQEATGNWQDFPNHGQSQQNFPLDPNASSSGLPSAAHLQPQQPQQDMSHTTASLFGQKVYVTGKRPSATDDTNTRSYSRSPSQQNLGTNHLVEESATDTTRLTNTATSPPPPKMPPHKAMNPQKKKEARKRIRHLTERKRVERNSKEQERSHQINHQFAELRQLLSANGIVVPKGTKSAVLEITLEYIRVLRERQQQLERYVHPKK